MWFAIALFVGSLVATILLMPKSKTENARAGTIDDLRTPRSKEGDPVNLLLGRCLIRGPNTIWAGDFKPVAIRKKQKTGMFSSKRVTVGYTYYVGLDLSLGIGPLTLHKIICDKDIVWEGNASGDYLPIDINKPNLFGGYEKGGGLIGTAIYYSGSWEQNVDSYLEAQIGVGDVPAYRGTSHIVFVHFNIGEANQLRTLHFEASRYTNDLQLPSGMDRIGDDLNPMELLYQVWTLEWGGLNIDPDLLDIESMYQCAVTLFNEANGMSLNISSPNSGKDITSEIMRQIDGLMYQNPVTGKIVFKLIRNDYVIEDLPIFDESNIVSLRGFTSKLWEDTINQMRVKFTNRDKNYEDGIAGVQDLANIGAQGRVRSSTNSYPGVTVGELANRLASRDLSQGSIPLLGANLETNRQGAGLRPGDPFLWSWKEYGIGAIVMRVKNFDMGALNDNKIAFEASQDIFAIDQTIFAPPHSDGSGIIRPDEQAAPATVRMVKEAPLFFANAAGITIGDTQSYIVVSAVAPAFSGEYSVYTSSDNINYNLSEEGSVYSASATINSAMTTGFSNIASLAISGLNDELLSGSAAEVLQGFGLFFIGQELLSYETVTDNGDGTATLFNVRRGLLDTLPSAHAAGARLWFMVGDNIVDDTYSAIGDIRVKLLTTTYSDTLALDDAPYDDITMNQRANRPAHPANIKFNGGVPYVRPATPVGSVTIDWANRSRLSLIVHSTLSDESEHEPNQRTVIRHRIGTGSWVEHEALPGVRTYTFDAGAASGQTVTYEIFSRRDGLDSLNKLTFSSPA